MLDLRTLALGLGVGSAAFLAGVWLDIGQVVTRSLARPALDAGASAAPEAPVAVRAAPKALERKGLTDDAGLRAAVVAASASYRAAACDRDARARYVDAATKFAEKLMRTAGCHSLPRCPISTAHLARIWAAHRAPADVEIGAAMAAAHGAGGIGPRDFPADVGRAVLVIAEQDFSVRPAPACSSEPVRRQASTVRVRRR